MDAIGEGRDFGARALDVVEVLGAQVGVRALLVGQRLFKSGDALLVAFARRFVLGNAPQRRLEPLRLGLAGLAQADVVLRRQRALVGRLLERQLNFGEALVAGGEFAAHNRPISLAWVAARRNSVSRARSVFSRTAALLARFALRRRERRLDTLKPQAQLAIVALRGGGGGDGRFPIGLRGGVTGVQGGVGVLDQRVLGFQLLQPRLAGFELDQQIGQRRQQGVELFALRSALASPSPTCWNWRAAPRCACRSLRASVRLRAAARPPAGRRLDAAPRTAPRRLQFFASTQIAVHSSLPAAQNPKDARGNAR